MPGAVGGRRCSPAPRKVVTPGDFTDLGQIRDRLAAFQARYNAVARPFSWKVTRSDLDTLLDRIDADEATRSPQLAA
jgi:hypothetical protein